MRVCTWGQAHKHPVRWRFSTAGCKIPFPALSKNWALNLDWLDKLRNPHTCTARRENAAHLTGATDTGEGLGVWFRKTLSASNPRNVVGADDFPCLSERVKD